MVEPTWIKLVATLVFVAGIVWFVRLQFKIAEPIELEADEQLPDESEVFGKELNVGFRFIKDGEVIEVVEGKCIDCYYKGSLKCNVILCVKSERPTYSNEVIFKKVDDGMVSIR